MDREFTREEMAFLSSYEDRFRTSIAHRYALPIPQSELRRIHATFVAATGNRGRFNGTCGACLLHLMQDCGAKYFAQLEAEKKAKRPKGTKGQK